MPRTEKVETCGRYRLFRPITTRWSDNDIYGHWKEDLLQVAQTGLRKTLEVIDKACRGKGAGG